MASDRSQILDLFATGRIDFGQAERLLCLVSMRDRFLTMAVWAMLLIAASWNHFPHFRVDYLLQAAFQSATGTETFQTIQLFFIRFLGELP